METRSIRRGALLAAATGLLLPLAFPASPPLPVVRQGAMVLDTGWQWTVALFAFVPLLAALEGARPRRAAGLAFLSGVIFFWLLLAWINVAIHHYGHVPLPLSELVVLLLAAIMALYWAAAAAGSAFLADRAGLPVWLTFPASLTLSELLREHLLSGFPWGNPAYALYRNLPLIQSAAVWGVYGLCFLALLSNAALYRLARERGAALPHAAVIFGLLAALHAAGAVRIEATGEEPDAGQVRIAMIQANIEQDIKNLAAVTGPEIIARYRELTSAALAEGGTDLVIWPEGAYPYFFMMESRFAPPDLPLPPSPAWLLLGTATHNPVSGGEGDFRNSAYLIRPGGSLIAGRYDKTHLVPFGEYVPLRRLLPVEKLVPGGGIFMPGVSFDPLPMDGTRIGALICYEGIFPGISRKIAAAGAELFVNLTNDAWYGDSAGPYQHLAFYALRAVETDRAVARSTNTGISAVINPDGAIRNRSAIYTSAVVRDTLVARTGRTPYVIIGDWPVIAAILILTGVWGLRHRRRRTDRMAAG